MPIVDSNNRSYNQFAALTNRYLKRVRKLLKGNKNKYPEISNITIYSWPDKEVALRIELLWDKFMDPPK